MLTARIAAAIALCAAVISPTAALAAGSPKTVAISNAAFESTQTPKPGKYACCFSKWLFINRTGKYKLTAAKRGESTVARIDSDGPPGRADLLGPFIKLPAFTEFDVEGDVRVRVRGATGVVALHPPFDRRQVDLALVTGPRDKWQRLKTTLRAGAATASATRDCSSPSPDASVQGHLRPALSCRQ